MATLCPCGCGRKVRQSTKRAAVGVRNMDTMLSMARPAIEKAARGAFDADATVELVKFIQRGERIRGWFLDHVHKQMRPGETPDLLQLEQMMAEWGGCSARSLRPGLGDHQ